MTVTDLLGLILAIAEGESVTLYSPRRKVIISTLVLGNINCYSVSIYKKSTDELLREYTTDKPKRIVNEVGKYSYLILLN